MGQTHRKGGIAYGVCDRCGEGFERVAKGQPYRFCSRECARVPVMDRLLSKLQGSHEPGGCLIWVGKRRQDGYGEIEHEGRIWKVHRLMWVAAFGDIPDGIEVCHKCDNPSCARIDHLFLGTHTENMRDMTSKGRGVLPAARGEKHGASKLTEAEVLAIFKDCRPQSVIAESYGVAPSLISQIKRRKVWKHVHGRAAA